ncbi:peptidoglycan-binding domain-containing protein [Actinomadura violacea]|uniref:peptidoglycan-binding domain-containing protein n=1 Tax=Actinomadura violacea TaxID=2819934 RepID=UPI001E616B11|nr:peptidoglycan-binding domain-containing protein [Actinomadura violacea]
MSRRRWIIVTGVALSGAVGAAAITVAESRTSDHGGAPVTAVTTSTAEVVRTVVAERQQVNGTLGHAGTFNVVSGGHGVVTRLPAAGDELERGRAAFEVDGAPVTLLYGRRPAWRGFHLGMTKGTDVKQLETNLRAMGYGDGVTVDDHFTSATYRAIRHWQSGAHMAVTGTLPLGRVVFLPSAVRVGGTDVKLGAQVQPGILVAHGTSDKPVINVQLSPAQLPTVRVGDPVVVTLPDGRTRPGRITAIGGVASTPSSGASGSGSSSTTTQSTAPVSITVAGSTHGFLDQAQVQIAITVQAHKNVLAVPTTALRALPGDRYQVIVADGAATRPVLVETGLFDETTGLAEVSGQGLAAGQKVEVPRDDA